MAGDDDQDSDPESETADQTVQTKKTEVIRIVFERLGGLDAWPENGAPAASMVVRRDLLIEAINARNANHPGTEPLSIGNPANFLKDFIRKDTCNANWPSHLAKARITARQVYGDTQVFEFVRFRDNDPVPFPNRFDPVRSVPVEFESLTIPVEARKLGRRDEPWLIQVAVSQRLIATHLAIQAAKAGLSVESLAHLQVSVKTQPEIDATFVATIQPKTGSRRRAYVTVEAKQYGERILEHQIREQVKVAFAITAQLEAEDERIDSVIPIVLKVVAMPDAATTAEKKERYIYIAQFNEILRDPFRATYASALHEMPLTIQSSALYRPFPPIAGISPKPPKARSRPARPARRVRRGD